MEGDKYLVAARILLTSICLIAWTFFCTSIISTAIVWWFLLLSVGSYFGIGLLYFTAGHFIFRSYKKTRVTEEEYNDMCDMALVWPVVFGYVAWHLVSAGLTFIKVKCIISLKKVLYEHASRKK